MIDPRNPDYMNLPTCDRRPHFGYRPAEADGVPPVSIITPCYNVEDWYFDETVACVLQQSMQHFEWLLVDDGSSEPESVALLESLSRRDSRVRLIRQENAGPGAARNRGAAEARGEYLLWLDADDLIEPTYVEKAMWCLDSHPQFAFCNAWPIGFGNETYLWPRGFDRGRSCLHENQSDSTTLVRRDLHLAMGGFDESIRVGHEDWDYWLSMASHGAWGWTIPEFHIWYRRRDDSRINRTEGDADRRSAFIKRLREKHADLYKDESRFPTPPDPDDFAPGRVTVDIPWTNGLANTDGRNRLLFVVPWLRVGGADKFNLDVIEQLRKRGWDITIATTLACDHVWLPEFAHLTPDIFCLDKFLKLVDYPRFLLYLLRSRGITHVLMSNSQLGYELLPMLRAHYPQAAYLDYCHSAPPKWKDGGYPAMAARWTDGLDLHVVSSNQLRGWMAERGAHADKIEVVYTNINPNQWDPTKYDRAATRKKYLDAKDPPGRPIVIWTGRFVDDKRPLVLVEILRRLRDEGADFLALLVGDGEHRAAVADFVQRHDLGQHVRLVGTLPNQEIPPLLAAADVFLLPSQVEGISLAIFEAMAMEVVPVSAVVGGQAELVTKEVGCLIPHGEREEELKAYVTVLRRLIEEPAHRQKLAAAARRRIVDRFNLGEMGAGVHAALLQAGKNHGVKPLPVMPKATATECASLSVDRLRLERLADDLWATLQRERGESAPEASPPGQTSVSLARAELTYIENSRSWRTVQRIKRTLLYRAFARSVHGKGHSRLDCSDPRDKLDAIKCSRFYRMLQAIKRTRLYRIYARRKHGPNFANPWA